MNFLSKSISKLFGGNKHEKDIKLIEPLVGEINAFYEKLQPLTNDQLRNKTNEFKATIAAFLKPIDDKVESMRSQADAMDMDSAEEKDDLYKQVDELIKERDKELEKVLLQILPEAFAVVKETAHRFSENKELVSNATQLDRDLTIHKDFIRIEGDKAIYSNTWDAAGGTIVWNMVHYDVQLIGGVVLHQGKIAEMATGEGKTLVATLPAYLNALPGLGVHIVTVNNYLALRDSEWNAPLFNFLGITIDCIDKHQPNSEERRKAYLNDITYGTNNEFGFDYLRDNMVRTSIEKVQRKHHYAMVDEVDSVLVDDARTPLIISGPVPKGDIQEFGNLKPRIIKIYEAQRKIANVFLTDAKRLYADGKTKEAGLALLRAYRALPKNTALIKFLSEQGARQLLLDTEGVYMAENNKRMPEIDKDLFFVIDERHNSVDLTDKGIELITESGEDPHFFIIPDVGAMVADIERSEKTKEEKVAEKDVLMQDFSIKSERIHSLQQLLKAYTLFEKDVEYVVMDGKVKIVDEQTGRILEGRRYSDGLHQAIESKENVKVEAATQTYATITLQNYFRMYHKLAGMTGTAETEAGELWEIYKLDVTVIPTNRAITRKDLEDYVYKTRKEKFNAVIARIDELVKAGRPVLVGTTSVEISELLSRMLQMKGVKHNVLNAKQHQREAEIVAEAGKTSSVTIATNMAGRGTDIKLGEGVKEAGGLAIIGTERHDSRRVDRQLRGRAGRQGDPGSSEFYVSLEDNLMRLFGSDRISKIMDTMGYKEGEVIQHGMITKSIERAQKKVEENNFGVRKRLLEYDDVMNSQRELIYRKRNHALQGERLAVDINNTLMDLCEEVVAAYYPDKDYEGFTLDVIRYFSTEPEISAKDFANDKQNVVAEKLYQSIKAFYKRKQKAQIDKVFPLIKDLYQTRGETLDNVIVPYTDSRKGVNVTVNLKKAYETEGWELAKAIERSITLIIIDEHWKEHLRSMDDLKQAVQGAVYEQKDPLLIYKFEAFEMFKKMLSEVNHEIANFIFKGNIPIRSSEEVKQAQAQRTNLSHMKESREDAVSRGPGAVRTSGGEQQKPLEPVRVEKKVGRNDACPCGSGKKYKNCHGKDE
ncbi:MAG: preprotein translocase subunit SecA [Chitinophagales bacterium]|nr:preprotein translocase subunit SecA [Bacteroidota bacterium]MBP7399952.1 preprotein translocase subunit SecA [Chitinophagales bacterium]MBK8486800.1 preprotein translocase subunit SecA [Bacteroidota bacterium]MBK8681305.1 preprotein translocase subunit SecA [Bacteroidota bacterium]MBP9189994.1 preprotein translocase subunit SecA [Chitinophagales bacterium]